jgi:hypothetical protein
MAWIGPLVEDIVAIVTTVMSIVQVIRGEQAKQAKQTDLVTTELLAGESKALLASPTEGLHALKSILDDTNGDLAVDVANLTDLINSLSGYSPAPPDPPPYPGTTSAAVLSALLDNPWWGNYEQTQQLQQVLYQIHAELLGKSQADGWPDKHGPWFALCHYGSDFAWGAVSPLRPGGPVLPPTNLDWTAWDGEMSLVEFLTDFAPDIVWDHVGPGGYGTPGIVWGRPNEDPACQWRCLVAEWQLPFVSGRAWAALAKVTDGLPPVWPGLDKVSLGTPENLTESAIITAAMDGILMDVTADKPGAGGFGADGSHYTWRGGWLAFLDATGRAEEYQFMGWASAFYLPKHMAHAFGVCLVMRDISACTVTPFTID